MLIATSHVTYSGLRKMLELCVCLVWFDFFFLEKIHSESRKKGKILSKVAGILGMKYVVLSL